MPIEPAAFREDLDGAARRLEWDRVQALCQEFQADLKTRTAPFPEREARRILQILRGKRFFDQMGDVACALIQSGQAAPTIRRQLAQALIDRGELDEPLGVLQSLVADTAGDPDENVEAGGLNGRLFKQRYVVHRQADPAAASGELEKAVQNYFDVYMRRPATHLWHGINVVALLCRAERDGSALAGYPDPRELAGSILAEIDDRHQDHKADTWDFATAAEACVALDLPEKSMRWAVLYARSPYTGGFELASTLRQFTEIWDLRADSWAGKYAGLMALLETELLRQGRGHQEITTPDARPPGAPPVEYAPDFRYEKVFSDGSLMPVRWFATGIERARLIARIDQQATGTPYGTGFLIRARDLGLGAGDEILMLTNAHVVSDDPQVQAVHKALAPDDAEIHFTMNEVAVNPYRIGEVLWTSTPEQCDATLVRLDKAPPAASPAPVAPMLPVADGKQSVWVMGHPSGRALSFSARNNVFIAAEGRLLRYRAATEGGSSGSPVFNNEWKLIGLHHAAVAVKLADGEANEGIWLQSIIQAMKAGNPPASGPAAPGP
jgi:hypothetical protein